MKDVLTLVLAGGQGERLYPLTMDRAKPAVPFGGLYRIIDFTLSNCLNSGLRRIYVLTQYKSLSLDRHLRLGWDILSPELGELIASVPPQLRVGKDWYQGTADAVFQNVYILQQERPGSVLILSGDHIYAMDYGRMIAFHEARQAELTISTFRTDVPTATRMGVLHADANGRVLHFVEKPAEPPTMPGDPDHCLVSMGVYVFNTTTLVRALSLDARNRSAHDFGKNIIPDLIARNRRVYAYEMPSHIEGREPYWRDIGTLDSYYGANMDLVSVTPELNLYDEAWPFRTFPYPLPPAKFVFATPPRQGVALDSIVSPGCIISGGIVERSVLSPLVRVNSWSSVRESVLMDGVSIGRHAVVEKAILDKGVRVPKGYLLGGDPERDRKRGLQVTEGGVVVVPRGTVLG